jgi:hypothetical protein
MEGFRLKEMQGSLSTKCMINSRLEDEAGAMLRRQISKENAIELGNGGHRAMVEQPDNGKLIQLHQTKHKPSVSEMIRKRKMESRTRLEDMC